MDDVLTAVPGSGVQPLASGDHIQCDVTARRPRTEEEVYEVMVMSGALADFERDSREAAAAEAAIEAEAEAVENEDDDVVRVRCGVAGESLSNHSCGLTHAKQLA